MKPKAKDSSILKFPLWAVILVEELLDVTRRKSFFIMTFVLFTFMQIDFFVNDSLADIWVWVFIPISCVIMSMKARLLRSIYLWSMKRVYQQNPFRSPRKPLRPFLVISDIFLIFPFEIEKIYLLSLVLIEIDQIWEMGFDWRTIWGSRMAVVPKCKREGVEELKSQKIVPVLSQSMDTLKLCNKSKNQPRRSIRRRDMGVYPFLTLKNSNVPLLSLHQNWDRKLKFGIWSHR